MNDSAAPVLLGLILPSIFKVGPDSTIEVGASARDPDGQAVSLVQVYLDREFANLTFQKPYYTRGHTDTFSVHFAPWSVGDTGPVSASSLVSMLDATAPGTYRVLKVAVTDLAGNRAVYAASELQAMGINTMFEVKGSLADTAAPVLLGLDMPASVDLRAGRSTLDLRLRVQDNAQGAGVDQVIVRFDRELGHGYGKTVVLQPANLTRDGQSIELANLGYQLGPQTMPGSYRIDDVTVVDFAGNRNSYTGAQLAALGMDTVLEVKNSAAQAALTQSLGDGVLQLDLASTAWKAAEPNSFRLVLGYSADALHFDSAALAARPGGVSAATTSTDGWVQLVVTGAGLTAAEAMAGIRIALRPVEGVHSAWQLTELSVNGQDQVPVVEAPTGDFLQGGDGSDRADFRFAREDATVTRTAAGFEVRSAFGQTTVVADVERLRFGEDYVDLDEDGVAVQAYRLYQAAVDRKPDAAGLGYWIYQMEAGASLQQVAQAFMAGSEFRTLYGSTLSDAGFITALYDNVLHRAPDEAGLAWWRAAFADGLTREEALVYFSESAENVAQVAPLIANGIDYTLW